MNKEQREKMLLLAYNLGDWVLLPEKRLMILHAIYSYGNVVCTPFDDPTEMVEIDCLQVLPLETVWSFGDKDIYIIETAIEYYEQEWEDWYALITLPTTGFNDLFGLASYLNQNPMLKVVLKSPKEDALLISLDYDRYGDDCESLLKRELKNYLTKEN